MHPIKIRRSGNSLGATLPKEVLQKLKEVLQKLKVRPVRSLAGGTIKTVSTDGFQITAYDPDYDPDFEAAMQAFAETRKNYRNALRELAK